MTSAVSKLAFSIAVLALPHVANAQIDENYWYRLTTAWRGDGQSLDVINDGKGNNRLWLAKTGSLTGQFWKFTKLDGTYYRLTTMWRTDNLSLDIINDGKNNNLPWLAETGPYSGQAWKVTRINSTYCRLTTNWRGPGFSLDIINDGKNNNLPILAATGPYSGQAWKLTKLFPINRGRFTPFGRGCLGANGRDTLLASGDAHIGGTAVYTSTNGPGSGLNLMRLGLSDKQLGPIRLPFDNAPLGAAGCLTYVDRLVWLVGVNDRNGRRTVNWTHPNDPGFVGLTYFMQAFNIDQTANRLGLTTSNAVRVDLSGRPGLRTGRTVSVEAHNFPGMYMRHASGNLSLARVRTSQDRREASFRVRRGLAGIGVSLESMHLPGYFLRHQNGLIKLVKLANTHAGRREVTFLPRIGQANSKKISFESLTKPGYFIRHRGFLFRLETGTTSQFRNDATFRVVDALGS